jgi:hypothetical protein
VPDQLRHGLSHFLPLEIRVGLGLLRSVEELFAPEVEEDVDG